jgi:hypothetical protein
MAKKITVTLSATAEKQFAELDYSLDLPHKKTTQSDIVNHCMEECRAFEEITGEQITAWLAEHYAGSYKAWVAANITPQIKQTS